MQSWTVPVPAAVPAHPDRLRLHDTATGERVHPGNDEHTASLYVCGITPYDATHLGHANTYVAFDLLHRYWRAAGLDVAYAQNVTDIDDPLLERAAATGVDWRALAQEQTDLFRADMAALNVLPPHHYVAVTDVIDSVVRDVEALVDAGIGYTVAGTDGAPDGDVYFDNAAAEAAGGWTLGSIGAHTAEQMRQFFAERGGDPERPGKRDPLDPLLWRAARPGEPDWDGRTLGRGRPGWHIECCSIARDTLPSPFTVQAGGSDLRFPHHEFSAAHATALTGRPLAHAYVHSGMVALDGEKMSKSLGNLELVSRLRARGVEPVAIRAALLAHHYRTDWEWSEEVLAAAERRVAAWRAAGQAPADPALTATVHARLVDALADDLDAPTALRVLDGWADGSLVAADAQAGASIADAGRTSVPDLADALLGLRL